MDSTQRLFSRNGGDCSSLHWLLLACRAWAGRVLPPTGAQGRQRAPLGAPDAAGCFGGSLEQILEDACVYCLFYFSRSQSSDSKSWTLNWEVERKFFLQWAWFISDKNVPYSVVGSDTVFLLDTMWLVGACLFLKKIFY